MSAKANAKRTIKLGVLYRNFAVVREEINEKDRTVGLSFSSETPVERWFGYEILDHRKTSVMLDRLNRGGALLVDHNTRDQVGVIESSE
ncbi:MAG: phage major capsid protein, partial [Verrucomicrobiota bacterium]